MKFTIKFIWLVGIVCLALRANAQMPNDAIYMNKNSYCAAASYTNNSWKNYWENTLKRENLNIGTLTTQSYGLMLAAGVSNRLNILVGLPYVATNASAGNLMGQKGVQDLSAWLKYKILSNPSSSFSLHGIVGASVPTTNYVPNFLPMSIGLHSNTLMFRLMANYRRLSGFYATAHASYIVRSNISIDQDAYQANNQVYNTNKVNVPNATDWKISAGILKNGIQAELFAENFSCANGDYIRRNDMPFPTNNMKATSLGFYGKYQPKKIGVNARVGYVVDGLNVGQSTTYSVGLLYQFGKLSSFCSSSQHMTGGHTQTNGTVTDSEKKN